jgi:hypothetical protein
MTIQRIVTLVLAGMLTASVANAQALVARDVGRAGVASEARDDAASTAPRLRPMGAVDWSVVSKSPSPRDDAISHAMLPTSTAEGSTRRRHTAIGAAVGAAVGLVAYAINQHGCRSGNGIPCTVGAGSELALLVSGGALVGAVVGAVLPHGP